MEDEAPPVLSIPSSNLYLLSLVLVVSVSLLCCPFDRSQGRDIVIETNCCVLHILSRHLDPVHFASLKTLDRKTSDQESGLHSCFD